MKAVVALFSLLLPSPVSLCAHEKDANQERRRALEERIHAPEAEVQALKAAQTAAVASALTAPSVTAQATLWQSVVAIRGMLVETDAVGMVAPGE